MTVDLADIDEPDKWVDVTGEVAELWDPNADSIAQVGLLRDETGTCKFVKWKKSDLQELVEGQEYHFENVVTDEYQGRYSVQLNSNTRISEASGDDIDVAEPTRNLRRVISGTGDGDGKQTDHRPPSTSDQPPWAWASTVKEFLATEPEDILQSAQAHYQTRFEGLPLDSGQIEAWRRTIEVFQTELAPLEDIDGGPETLLVMEYELPGEGGRRPDVVLVTPTQHVFSIECKNRSRIEAADLDQALQYKQDLERFHSETHDCPVHAYLAALTEGATGNAPGDESSVKLIAPGAFEELLAQLSKTLTTEEHNYTPERWLKGEYKPLPHLTEAVIATFENQSLPRIKQVESSNVPATISQIRDLAAEAKREGKYVLVLVTGAPGSGKTLVGIKSTILMQKDGTDSLFLSGNGPLVAVLQDAFDRAGDDSAFAKSIIRPMYKFKPEITGNPDATPANVYIFDEGQRAWTAEQNKQFDGSEIELLLQTAERSEWGLVVGLIGEGQAIHKGETGGLDRWMQEVLTTTDARSEWEIALPNRAIRHPHTNAQLRYRDELHLDTSIRSKTSDTVHNWAEAVLDGDVKSAAQLASDIQAAGYQIYITSQRDVAEQYATRRYGSVPDARYGWVVSSEHENLDSDGVEPTYVPTSDAKDVWGPWFNAPPDHPDSCCQLETACNEFGCQGLELDLVLLYWGTDLKWRDGEWETADGIRTKSETPAKHTRNAYRVFLTRGREGIIICCRDTETRRYLKRCGATSLGDR